MFLGRPSGEEVSVSIVILAFLVPPIRTPTFMEPHSCPSELHSFWTQLPWLFHLGLSHLVSTGRPSTITLAYLGIAQFCTCLLHQAALLMLFFPLFLAILFIIPYCYYLSCYYILLCPGVLWTESAP